MLMSFITYLGNTSKEELYKSILDLLHHPCKTASNEPACAHLCHGKDGCWAVPGLVSSCENKNALFPRVVITFWSFFKRLCPRTFNSLTLSKF